jgi:polyvinyl alcohol dehydrogenase (cytochrome)
VGQQVFVSSSTAKVFALDARTGKTIWEFDSAAPVRTAISVAQPVGSDCAGRIAYFGDQKANVYAVDANTGKELWRVTIDDFPGAVITGSPTLHAGRVYVPLSSSEEALAGFNPQYECCKFRGSIVALNAATGALLWKSYTIPDTPVPTRLNSVGTQMFGPAGAGVWSSPTIDARRNVLYVGTGNSYTEVDAKTADAILAFDLDTGALKWSHQFTAQDNFIMMCEQPGVNNCPKVLGQDYDFGASPILQNLPGGKRLLLAGQKSGALYALDPDKSGELVWEAHLSPGSYLGGIQWGPAVDERTAYVAISDVVAGNGVPGLHALDIKDGRKLWSVPAPTPDCAWGTKGCSHAQSQALTVIPGVVFSGSIDGHMRAYDTRTGAILWDFDTARSFPAVNGATAQGGSLDGGGPAVAGGMLLVNSGYALVSGAPGNALIAFSTDDASAVVANADRGR